MSSDGPAHRVQSAVVEYGYPQGHLGHLSADEEAAFKNFKLVLQEKALYTPGTDDDEDDITLSDVAHQMQNLGMLYPPTTLIF